MSMNNPFIEIDVRLSSIENLLLEITKTPKQGEPVLESKKLYSIKDLADFLQVSATTAQKYKNEGLPCIQYGRKVVFDADEVLNWLRNPKKGGFTHV